MKFDTPATTNPIDQLKVVGKPTDRIDGPLKTTGTAPYAYERHDVVPEPGLWLCGRRGHRQGPDRLDRPGRRQGRAGRARHRHRARMPASSARASSTPPSCSAARRSSTITRRSRWSSPRPSSRRAPPRSWSASTMSEPKGAFDLAAAKDTAVPARAGFGGPADTAVGDFAGAFAAAPVKLDATYTTPDQAHAMMEPHASIAAWDGDKLTLWTSNQMIDWSARRPGQDARHPQGERPPDLALHRRRLRRQAVRARRRAARGARRARGAAAGEGGAAAAA